ncbi:MAG: sigma-70 family RNA polymerase sigma factor [Hyphomicrobiales bacterium]|nr:sigma-70 family RNA polymerase sigma factor [Hyphomicrobiales bacterium]
MDETAIHLEQHIPALRRYAYALVKQNDAADDLVQDCLERAVGRWHLRHRDGNLRAWLLTILRNQFINTYRQRRRRGVHFALEDVVEPETTDSAPDSSTAIRDIFAGLDTLPEEQRSVILLVGVEDLSYDEAARVLGLPVGTVMSRLSRGRAKLREYLETGRIAVLRRVK